MEQVAQTGRSALVELRRALGVLRDPDDPGLREPVPGLAELDLLLDRVRAGGLTVDLVREGDRSRSAPGRTSRSTAPSRRR